MVWNMLNYIAEQGVIYFAFNTKISVDEDKHAFIGTETCPRCGKPLVIKTNRKKGTKFYSCQPPQFGGDGCGYIENID